MAALTTYGKCNWGRKKKPAGALRCASVPFRKGTTHSCLQEASQLHSVMSALGVKGTIPQKHTGKGREQTGPEGAGRNRGQNPFAGMRVENENKRLKRCQKETPTDPDYILAFLRQEEPESYQQLAGEMNPQPARWSKEGLILL